MNAETQTLAKRQCSTVSRPLETVMMAIAIGLGAIQAYNYRFEFSTEDIVAYLDVADAYLQGTWSSAINGNWSPLYSWCLAIAQAVLNWAPAWDACRVKLVNFIIFLSSLLCFRFFLHGLLWLEKRREGEKDAIGSVALPIWFIIAGGYVLFLWSALRWIGLFCDTPDMSTAAIVYLACGVLLRIQIGPRKWPYFAALGAILGLGYLSKAAMFPLAFIFLFAATSSDDGFRLKLAHLFVALLTFSMTAGPYAAALSSAKGRLTFSDTGKLSYVWFVDPGTDVVPDQHWQGGPAGYGQPLHPTRLLYNDPALYEFAAPIGGTYPPGTDPSYWYDGVQVRFDPAKVWAIARWNVEFYWNHFLAALLAGLLLLTCVGGRPAGFVLALVERWRIVVPAVCGLGMYAMTTDFFQNTFPQQPSTRFIASFAVVLFAAGVTAIRFKPSAATRRLVLGLTCAGLLFAGWGLSGRTVQEIKAAIHNKQQNKHWRSAQVLRRLGIGPGSRVAIIGPEYDHEFWARLARVKIIAQVPDGNAFLAKDFPVRALIFLLLEHAGADAVVWKQDKDQGYSAYFFHPVK